MYEFKQLGSFVGQRINGWCGFALMLRCGRVLGEISSGVCDVNKRMDGIIPEEQ